MSTLRPKEVVMEKKVGLQNLVMKEVVMLRKVKHVSFSPNMSKAPYFKLPFTDVSLARQDRPLGRGKRIKRDLKQLWKDIFGRDRGQELSTTQLAHHTNNELRTVCENERQNNIEISPIHQNNRRDGSLKADDRARPNVQPNRNDQLNSDAQPNNNAQPNSNATAPINELTLSETSSNTAREPVRSCGLPPELCNRRKQKSRWVRFGAWWTLKVSRDPVARHRARQAQWDQQNRDSLAAPAATRVRFETPDLAMRRRNTS
jgi:hypothetical protein